ncbi:MAG: right-handed parallel beta-helix repeat-containing protein, partial [Rhodobacteraceae bacterium]|nr:right-handed parallel beta-helix repeat-containing protein [Paracoccaceae bacterium]
VAAAGRAVLVPAGTFHIASSLSMEAPMRFEGTLSMPADARLELNRSFDFPTYAAAFGDEAEGLRRGLQALFNATDHQTFDLRGRRVQLAAPIDVHAAVGNKDSFAIRRGLTNGQIELMDGPAWDTGTVTSQATYSPGQPFRLSGVANVANIPVGALVEGSGVGREVYVTERNVGAGTLSLSQPLFDATGTQTFTFRRFRYALDFSGFTSLSSFEITNIEFLCKGVGSAIMLAPEGLIFRLADCVISKPKDRGVTSIGRGCQGMFLDRCQFLSNEQPQPAQSRTTIAFNVNANDVKVRDCRAVRFLHFGVMGGAGHILNGNHFFQGDEENQALRTAGIVLTSTNPRVTITGNYIDNCWIEWG